MSACVHLFYTPYTFLSRNTMLLDTCQPILSNFNNSFPLPTTVFICHLYVAGTLSIGEQVGARGVLLSAANEENPRSPPYVVSAIVSIGASFGKGTEVTVVGSRRMRYNQRHPNSCPNGG